MSFKNEKPMIIIDPDISFLESLKNIQPPVKQEITLVSDGKIAQLMLSNLDFSFSGIFVNPEISYPGGISVIRSARIHHPGTPIFLICNQESPFTEDESRKLGIQKNIQKQFNINQLISLIYPKILHFTPEKLNQIPSNQNHSINQIITEKDSEFLPIRSSDFLSGNICYFDLYIRLNANKYIKILQSGDKFQPQRVQSYLERGVSFFYLRKDDQEYYLAFCEKLSASLIHRKDIHNSVKLSQVMNHGEETFKFLKNFGISETNIKYASQFLENIQSLIKTLKPGENPLFKGFLKDIISYDHAVGVTTITSLLMPALRIESNNSIETIGLSAFFHDIGLIRIGMSSEDMRKMNQNDYEKFKTHPILGAEIVSHIEGFKPVTIQAILQHHERRNRKGFPYQLGHENINPISEMIGISDEFHQILIRLKENENFDLKKELKIKIFDAFSQKYTEAFKKVFFLEKKELI